MGVFTTADDMLERTQELLRRTLPDLDSAIDNLAAIFEEERGVWGSDSFSSSYESKMLDVLEKLRAARRSIRESKQAIRGVD